MLKKTKSRKLTIKKVQDLFNAAIRRRDGQCVMAGPHAGNLESSHFFTVGGNGCLRFYPPCAHAQCTSHHNAEFHNDNPLPYMRWMEVNVPELEWMELVRKTTIRYSQPLLREIALYCESDKLATLSNRIESLIREARGNA